MQKLIPVLNRYSLLFHVLLACGVCFAIEWISRHSFLSACSFVIDRNLVFLYNSLIVFASLMLVYTVKRRALLRTVISVLWLKVEFQMIDLIGFVFVLSTVFIVSLNQKKDQTS